MNPEYFAQEVAANAKKGMVDYDNIRFGAEVKSAASRGETKLSFDFRYKLSNEMLDALEGQGIELISLADDKYRFDISKLVNSLC